jgi:hypothetical protein
VKYGKKKGKPYKRSEMMQFYLNSHPNCEVCGMTPVEGHHLVTRSTGGAEEYWNYLALCKVDHTIFHAIGRYSFALRYPQFHDKIKQACEKSGRIFDKVGNKKSFPDWKDLLDIQLDKGDK